MFHPSNAHRLVTLFAIGALFLVAPARAHAEGAGAEAREAFEQGTKLVREERWAEALAAFERANLVRPHATTSFNVGICLRALGRYVVAAKTFRQALARDKSAHELAASLAEEARAFEAEMQAAVGQVTLIVEPPDASVSIDGRTFVADGASFVLGSENIDGAALPGGKATLVLDPGTHLVTLTRAGYARTMTPIVIASGRVLQRRIDIMTLPAFLRVDSTPRGAAVRVAGIDVGLTPLSVERPPGSYHMKLARLGYLPYETTMKVGPGEHADLRANLARDTPSLFSRWWFWTTVGAVAAGATLTTYLVTRPAEPLTGGSLGWVAGK